MPGNEPAAFQRHAPVAHLGAGNAGALAKPKVEPRPPRFATLVKTYKRPPWVLRFGYRHRPAVAAKNNWERYWQWMVKWICFSRLLGDCRIRFTHPEKLAKRGVLAPRFHV